MVKYIAVCQYYPYTCSHLGKNDAPTLDDFKQHLKDSYTPTPMVIDVEEVHDIKKWVSDSIEAIRGHTAPHHYRFKQVGEEVEMTYKHWSNDEEWETPECDTPLDLIREAANLPSTTSLVTPDFTSLNLDKLATDLKQLPSHYIPPDKMEMWDHLIEKLMENAAAANNGLTTATRSLPQFASITSSRTPAETPSTSTNSLLPPSIRKIVQKSNERPAVSYSYTCAYYVSNHDLISILHVPCKHRFNWGK